MKTALLNAGKLQRVAILRCCGLGDVAQMTPLLQQIRADAPQAKIEVFINANVSALLEGAPFVDRVHALPVSSFTASAQNPFLWHLWMSVREQGAFDCLFCLDLSWSRTVLAGLALAQHRIGFRTEVWKPYTPLNDTLTVPLDYPRNADHTSLWFLRLWLESTGETDRGYSADLSHLRDKSNQPLPHHVAIVPRAGNDLVAGDLKQWPLYYWPKLAQCILNQGWTPVVLGRAGDLDMSDMPAGTLDRLGKHSVSEAAAYTSRCAGLIGNDSGLYHLALAMGVRAVGLFGPTAVARTGPFRAEHGLALTAPLSCVPCCSSLCEVPAKGRSESERPFCLSALRPDAVWARAFEHFSRLDA